MPMEVYVNLDSSLELGEIMPTSQAYLGPPNPMGSVGAVRRTKEMIEPSDVFLHEKTQKLFKYARAKDKQEELKKELLEVKDKVQRGKLCQDRDERLNTALHYAAKAGNLDTCMFLVQEGADINALGQNNMTPLQFAARYGDGDKEGDESRAENVWTCMEWIMRANKNSSAQGKAKEGDEDEKTVQAQTQKRAREENEFFVDGRDDFTILHHAIQNTNWEENPVVVHELIKTRKFKITDSDKQGNTCLHLAAQFDKQKDHSLLEAFLPADDKEKGFQSQKYIDGKDLEKCILAENKVGMTPLHVACAVGNPDSVEQLLKVADNAESINVSSIINSLDSNGSLPLSLAITSKNLTMVDILMKKGAKVDHDSIITAARTGDVKIMEKLCERKIEEKTTRTTPLFVAAQHNQKEMVEHLLKKCKKDERTCNLEGVTPLLIAVREGNIEIVDMLLDKESVEEKDNEDRNVLHYAFKSREPEKLTMKIKDFIGTISESTTKFSEKMMDLLTAKDLNEDTPFHKLAEQNFEIEVFEHIFAHLNTEAEVLECLKEKNSAKETPLHTAANETNGSFVQAVLKYGDANSEKMEQLLFEKDEYSNTPLHLTTRTKRIDIPPLLDFVKKKAKDPMRYLTRENIWGWTPFSRAVAKGCMDMVRFMGSGLTLDERKKLVNQADFSNTSPLHVAAMYGHVDVFNLLLMHGADITRRGPDQHTALDVAIEKEQRGIIRSIIEGSQWEEAFKIPSTTKSSKLDTPLRNLIRRFPDLAEQFLDRCWTVEASQDESKDEAAEVINMKYGFIEDAHSYKVVRSKGEKQETLFCHKDEANEVKYEMKNYPLVAMAKERKVDLNELKPYVVGINNHPLMIMAKERRVDLLQHPLCLAITLNKWNLYGRRFYYFQLGFYMIFLIALNLFILSSRSPLDYPEQFNCSGKYFVEAANGETATNPYRVAHLNCTGVADSMNLECSGRISEAVSKEEEPIVANRLEHLNTEFRILLLVLNALRVLVFFWNWEYKPIWSQLRTLRTATWRNLPTVFLFDALVYTLAFFVAFYNLLWTTSSCLHWQICAVTLTLAWINLLINMRLLHGIGKYVILFQDVIFTFFAVSIVFVIMIIGFAFSFHLLLSKRQEFQSPYDALLKTFMMMSGEIDYSEIFFKDNPPLGWGDKWDQNWESVPFPVITYGMFLVFFFFVSIVALNVLVGLTVDDIRNFLENADLRKLTMRLKFILAMERVAMKHYNKIEPLTSEKIQKKDHLEASATSDLISKARIWEKIEKKQEYSRKKGETEEERRNLKDMINDQTNKLTTEINDQTLKLKNEMNRGGKFASVVRQSSQRQGQGHLSPRTLEQEEDKNGEMLSAIKSIISQLKEQRTEIESIKKMLKGKSNVE